jgi:hypothetical protein
VRPSRTGIAWPAGSESTSVVRTVSDFDRDREIARLLGFPARVEQFAPGFGAY